MTCSDKGKTTCLRDIFYFFVTLHDTTCSLRHSFFLPFTFSPSNNKGPDALVFSDLPDTTAFMIAHGVAMDAFTKLKFSGVLSASELESAVSGEADLQRMTDKFLNMSSNVLTRRREISELRRKREALKITLAEKREQNARKDLEIAAFSDKVATLTTLKERDPSTTVAMEAKLMDLKNEYLQLAVECAKLIMSIPT